MDLIDAIDLLEIEKGVCELDLSNGVGGLAAQEYVDAITVVIDYCRSCMSLDVNQD